MSPNLPIKEQDGSCFCAWINFKLVNNKSRRGSFLFLWQLKQNKTDVSTNKSSQWCNEVQVYKAFATPHAASINGIMCLLKYDQHFTSTNTVGWQWALVPIPVFMLEGLEFFLLQCTNSWSGWKFCSDISKTHKLIYGLITHIFSCFFSFLHDLFQDILWVASAAQRHVGQLNWQLEISYRFEASSCTFCYNKWLARRNSVFTPRSLGQAQARHITHGAEYGMTENYLKYLFGSIS